MIEGMLRVSEVKKASSARECIDAEIASVKKTRDKMNQAKIDLEKLISNESGPFNLLSPVENFLFYGISLPGISYLQVPFAAKVFPEEVQKINLQRGAEATHLLKRRNFASVVDGGSDIPKNVDSLVCRVSLLDEYGRAGAIDIVGMMVDGHEVDLPSGLNIKINNKALTKKVMHDWIRRNPSMDASTVEDVIVMTGREVV